MEVLQAVEILKQHNKWRNGADIPMVEPALLGQAIDVAIKVMEKETPKGNCGDCVHFENQYGDGVGWCREKSTVSKCEYKACYKWKNKKGE